MARLEVIQVQCDRCKRVTLTPPGPKKERPDFQASCEDKKLEYWDLCPSCLSTLQGTWKLLSEWDRPIQHQFGPTVQDNKAAPLTPAPDYSPPKPHSMTAAAKK